MVSILIGSYGTILGLPHPVAMSQSAWSMWSVKSLPKLYAEGASDFVAGQSVWVTVRSFAYKGSHSTSAYIESLSRSFLGSSSTEECPGLDV